MDEFEVLRENILFSDLSHSDFNKLLSISRRLKVEKDTFFLKEGEVANEFYFILSGKVEVLKSGLDHKEYVIAHIESGNAIGEIALLDNQPRSASVKAEVATDLLCIPFEPLKQLADELPVFNKIVTRIAANVGGCIRQTNSMMVKALSDQLEEYKMRTSLGQFMVNVIVSLCLFAFFLTWIIQFRIGAKSSTVISIPLTIAFLGLFFFIVKDLKLPLSTFGLTTHHWRKAVFESILFTLILCAIIGLLKWVLIHTTSHYSGHYIFEPYLQIEQNSRHLTKESAWRMTILSYVFIIVPLQELIVRGGLQGPLEILLTGREKTLKAILVSNFMFATTHLFMGIEIAFMVSFAGIYFGWLYSRHHTLIGVIIAHALLGTWSFLVIGL